MLSLVERAMIHNPSSETLLFLFIKLATQKLSITQSFNLWKNILWSFDPLKLFALWREFLFFSQSSFSIFSVPKSRALYLHFIQTLFYVDKHLSKSVKTSISSLKIAQIRTDIANIETSYLTCLRSYLKFEKQSGHYFQALQIGQALIEYNLFHPTFNYPITESDLKGIFKSYLMDNRIPKLGHALYASWRNSFEANLLPDNRDSNFLISYDFVSPFLFKFSESLNLERLGFEYLEFIGFPSVFTDEITLGKFSRSLDRFSCIEDIDEVYGLAGFNSLGSLENFFKFGKSSEKFSTIDQELLNNTLSSFTSLPYASFKVAYLVWSFFIDKSRGIACAKEILKNDPENYILYCWYARLKKCVNDIEGERFSLYIQI